MVSEITPLKEILQCISNNQNFVLQGGAGSGKTETLKNLVSELDKIYPNKKILCITHTNKAVEEIQSRIGSHIEVSTIHSLFGKFLKNYKRNIHKIIHNLFLIDQCLSEEHEDYKKAYEKYQEKLFKIKGEKVEKCIGKKNFKEQDVTTLVDNLNKKIKKLNIYIIDFITSISFEKIKYNERTFNSLKNLSYGHDGLIDLSYILFKEYPLLGRIMADNYDFIFIDEYQDTKPQIIEVFLEIIPKHKIVVGLFGDSMQGIYKDGIGDIDKYIENGTVVKIDKEDNYRCSEQVIKFINTIRLDTLQQELVLKEDKGETLEQRQGNLKLYYSLISSDSDQFSILDNLIYEAKNGLDDYKILMLTNKSIAKRIEIEKLFNIFHTRYGEDAMTEIEEYFKKIELFDVYELFKAYKDKEFNFLINTLKKYDYTFDSFQKKEILKEVFMSLETNSYSFIEALDFLSLKLDININESFLDWKNNKEKEIIDLQQDDEYKKFRVLYTDGGNTLTRFNNVSTSFKLTQPEFDILERKYKDEIFFNVLCSVPFPFSEIVNLYEYLNEEKEYITMHKTKGTGIENVIVVLDNFGWREYNFNLLFEQLDDSKINIASSKIFYVACSRAIKNLTFIKLVNDEDKEKTISYFNERNVDIRLVP